jgi:GntR family transcriptional regulator of arabinose operon
MIGQVVGTSKYRNIQQWILDGIETRQFQPGDKLPSESELCRQFGVSRNSVRQAINSLIHRGFLESRKGVGTFFLAQTQQLTRDIGLVCFFTGSYIFPRISRGCDQVSHRSGFHLLLNQSEFKYEKEREILARLKNRGVDGILIEPIYPGDGRNNLDLLEDLERSGTRIVLLDNAFPQREFSRVALDDLAGGRLAASHLWAMGHRRIGVLSDRAYQPKINRKSGALRFLEAAGAPVAAEWQLDFEGPVSSGRTFEAIDSFLARGTDRPTAFVCTSDEEAVELLKAAGGRGLRVPEDFSIVSFDNSELAVLPGISLTSIDHPGQYMGELATRILLEEVLNPKVSSHTTSLIQPRLVERGSVAKLQPQG